MAFEFISDRPVLDFLATIAERGTADLEHLRSEADLANWIVESGIVDEAPDIDTVGELARAKDLREAMFRIVAALTDQQPPSPDDCALVNAAAAVAPPVLRLESGRLRREGDLGAVLAVLARDCLDLYDSPDRTSLHRCADTTCTRLFIDRSRGQQRRWCGMKGCGDRAKAAAYRQRRRSAAAST